MTINFYCPVCGAPIRGVPDSAACQHGVCLQCRSRIPVPRARRLNDDEIVALLGPVDEDVRSPSESPATLPDPQPEQSGQKHTEPTAVKDAVDGDPRGNGHRGSDFAIISRSSEFLRSLISRIKRLNPHSIRRRRKMRSVLRCDERILVESDQVVLTNQRLLSSISNEFLELENLDSVFASDGTTSSDLILHIESKRHVFHAIERQVAYSVVASIRTMLAIYPASQALPAAARETSSLFDVVFGQTSPEEQSPPSFAGNFSDKSKTATAAREMLVDSTTERMVSRRQQAGSSAEQARMLAAKKLNGRGYRIEPRPECELVVRALRNCDLGCLTRLVEVPGNKPLRRAALAALRDLGVQAAGAIPALKRLLDSDELRITRADITQEDLQFLGVVTETYLVVSSERG